MNVDESNSAEAGSADTASSGVMQADVMQSDGRAMRLVQDNRSAVSTINAAESLRLIQAFTKIRDEDDRLIIIELAEQLAQKVR